MKGFYCMLAALFVCASLYAEDVNVTPSPDSTLVAFTRDNDLWVRRVSDGIELRITYDGTETVLNGYASWVYYEEILGRSSNYRAFWWSPDSRRIGFYRFDESEVTLFPIYSPFPSDGSLAGTVRRTRYPLAGEKNPSVRVGMAEVSFDVPSPEIVWAAFNNDEDQCFGTPFWSPDSREFFVAREPRRQNVLDLYAVCADDGSLRRVYHEEYPTWLNWIEQVEFTGKGLYMARDFETGWEQIYFLSYDGKTFRRLTSGENWDIYIIKVDERRGDVWFTAKRDSRIHNAVYRLDRRGRVTALTDPAYNVSSASLNRRGDSIVVRISNARTPMRKLAVSLRASKTVPFSSGIELPSARRPEDTASPQTVTVRNDGYTLYGLISYPRGFDVLKQYPVVMQLYGGPGTPYVRDTWLNRDAYDQWCYENGIIYIVVDPRSSGENGRRGMDEAFRRMTVIELQDYIAWARWLQSLPYVRMDRIGVEGFSFGGTTASMLVLRYPGYFRCGIAGGGVYDWRLYDSHYTERFMETPEANPDGYREASVISYVKDVFDDACNNVKPIPGALKLTHGTGDDNVHFQNTLLLGDALENAGYRFELMIYPDGMHGYRGAQQRHSLESDHAFWTKWLLE